MNNYGMQRFQMTKQGKMIAIGVWFTQQDLVSVIWLNQNRSGSFLESREQLEIMYTNRNGYEIEWIDEDA